MKNERGLPALGGARGSQGFTMLELLITMIIFSVLAGIAIPGFSSWLPKYRLRGAARDIYSNLQLARMTAVKDRANCGVLFNVAGHRYQVISSGKNRTWESASGSRAGDDEILKEVVLSEYGSGIAYGHGSAGTAIGSGFDNGVTFLGDGIVFDSRGMIVSPSGAGSTGGYVYVQNNKNSTYALGAWSSGVIVMRRWTGSTWEQ